MNARIGAIFPTTEIGSDPAIIKDFAQAAEDLGYSHIICYDHVLGARSIDRKIPLEGPYSDEIEFHEPLVLCGYLAAVTSTIELMTGVLVLPQRQTALVAKQAAQIDLLSGGRFRMAIGTGWNHVEYEALGMPYAVRGKMMEEQIGVLRQLWTKENVDFHGAYHRIDNASIRPLPGREIPIWFGGYAPVALKRAVRVGNGFFFGVKAAFPVMTRQGGGAIVNVSSVCALLATPHASAYSAAKAGVIGFSRAAAIEGAPHNIRVNVVIPGVVKTPGATSAFSDEETERRTAMAVPLRRIGDPVELANAILFLASDEASYITGTELVVDGGKTCELNIGGANMEAVEI